MYDLGAETVRSGSENQARFDPGSARSICRPDQQQDEARFL